MGLYFWSMFFMKTLSSSEMSVLVSFSMHVQQMQQNHGDEAKIIKVEYDYESGDFDVVTNKQETGRRRRISKLTADVVSWANSQLDQLEYMQQKHVKKMVCHFEHDTFGIDMLVETVQAEDVLSQNTDGDEHLST